MTPAVNRRPDGHWLLAGCVFAVAAWVAFTAASTGDWPRDAAPAVHALAHGRLSTYLSIHPVMGPFATLVQAPFVAVSGGTGLGAYRWASLPCVLAMGLLGLYLAGMMRRRGRAWPAQALVAILCVLNPLTFEALRGGHPEELLTTALAVGAVAAASEGRSRWATILLGLAIASKQWAVIAILPTLMALPRRRLRVAVGAAAIAIAIALPGILAAPGSFSSMQGNAASTGRVVTPLSIWYPAATVSTEQVGAGPEQIVARVHRDPAVVGALAHPLIVLLALGLPLALASKRRGWDLSGADAMALLALLSLLRCVLDPVDNLYYHEPLLVALLGWDALDRGRLPLRGLLGLAASLLFYRWSRHMADPAAFNVGYLIVVLTGGVAIAFHLFGRPPVLGHLYGWWCGIPSGRQGRSSILGGNRTK